MLLVAQRKLESIRVLDDVLERVKVIVVPTFRIQQQQQPEQRFREIARSAPQGDNRFTLWERCASYSCSVDAGVGTDPSIANAGSKATFLINFWNFYQNCKPESNPKFENLYQHRWTPCRCCCPITRGLSSSMSPRD